MTMLEVAIKKSLNTQQTSYGPRAAKTDDNAEQRRFLTCSGQATVRGLQRRTATLRVVLGLGNGPRRVELGAN